MAAVAGDRRPAGRLAGVGDGPLRPTRRRLAGAGDGLRPAVPRRRRGRDGPDLKNTQSLFAKRWTALRRRCEKAGDPVPKLTFGTIRKQFSEWATKAGIPAEVNDTVLCYGTPHPSGPLLLRHYSSRPWAAAFEATRKYGCSLSTVLHL